MRRIKFKHTARGSVLVEAILTVVIMAVGLTLIVQSMASALRAMALAEDYSSAMMLLEGRMFPYIAGDVSSDKEQKGQLTHFNKAYDYAVSVSSPQEADSLLHAVDARITWGSQGRKRTLTLKTFLFERSDDKT